MRRDARKPCEGCHKVIVFLHTTSPGPPLPVMKRPSFNYAPTLRLSPRWTSSPAVCPVVVRAKRSLRTRSMRGGSTSMRTWASTASVKVSTTRRSPGRSSRPPLLPPRRTAYCPGQGWKKQDSPYPKERGATSSTPTSAPRPPSLATLRPRVRHSMPRASPTPCMTHSPPKSEVVWLRTTVLPLPPKGTPPLLTLPRSNPVATAPLMCAQHHYSGWWDGYGWQGKLLTMTRIWRKFKRTISSTPCPFWNGTWKRERKNVLRSIARCG
mmetsp:Transcript_20302/g.57172  ORF Transcript_20302/g.57172 Transcript_20302/m.57172 type:complete len:267 (-) Transcript_20302:439-1239(-)